MVKLTLFFEEKHLFSSMSFVLILSCNFFMAKLTLLRSSEVRESMQFVLIPSCNFFDGKTYFVEIFQRNGFMINWTFFICNISF